jgi:hypothetical protein
MFLKSSLLPALKMRTNKQHEVEVTMTTLRMIKSIATRSHSTLLQDAVGAAALVVMLVMGLYLPVMI